MTTKKVLDFVKEEKIFKSLPKQCLLDNLEENIKQYSDEIASILKLALKLFADGFAVQKGAIFGFGKQIDDQTGTKLKISAASEEIMKKLDSKHVPLHNLGEERNVGLTNYEINIRGKRNLSSVSKKIVLNRSIDLLEENPSDFKKYKKPAENIKEIRNQWEEEMIKLQKDSYALKEAETTKRAATILKDTQFLKRQSIPGPFTSVDDIDEYKDSCPDSKEKNTRLYIEVRFHRMTSTRKKESDDIFRFKKSGKNLDTYDYANNLKVYFEQTRRLKNISLEDLGSVLCILHQSSKENTVEAESGPVINYSVGENTVEAESEPVINYSVGEHVAVFWREDDGGFRWYLGVVNELSKNKEMKMNC